MPTLADVRHVALDLDGTLYLGDTVFDVTAGFLADLARMGLGRSFVTNNSSRSKAEYVAHLAHFGIAAEAEEIFTSTDAAIELLRRDLPDARRLWVLAEPAVAAEIEAAGFELTADAPDDVPDAVLVAFDKTLAYSRLCRTAYWISQGLPYIATHPDRICPTDEPTILVDTGAVCAALDAATGRAPDAIAGKPSPRMLHGLCARHGVEHTALAVVGDRLYTDIAMAEAAGAYGALVLTGEATRDDLRPGAPRPDSVFDDVGAFGAALLESRT